MPGTDHAPQWPHFRQREVGPLFCEVLGPCAGLVSLTSVQGRYHARNQPEYSVCHSEIADSRLSLPGYPGPAWGSWPSDVHGYRGRAADAIRDVSRETRCGAARPAPPRYCVPEWGLAVAVLVSRETSAANLSAVVAITAFGTNPAPDPSIHTHGKAPAPGVGPWSFWKWARHGPHCRRHAPAIPGRGPDDFLPECGLSHSGFRGHRALLRTQHSMGQVVRERLPSIGLPGIVAPRSSRIADPSRLLPPRNQLDKNAKMSCPARAQCFT